MSDDVDVDDPATGDGKLLGAGGWLLRALAGVGGGRLLSAAAEVAAAAGVAGRVGAAAGAGGLLGAAADVAAAAESEGVQFSYLL